MNKLSAAQTEAEQLKAELAQAIAEVQAIKDKLNAVCWLLGNMSIFRLLA